MRLRYIDYTKGFAIVLMLFGHTMATINPIYVWIYSFHMPVFFVIDGILMNEREYRTGTESIEKIVFRRFYTAGIPYFIFGFGLALFYTVLNVAAHEPLSFENRIWELVTFQGIGSFWFLPVYVFADIIMNAVGKLGKYGGRARGGLAVLSLILVFLWSELWTTWFLEVLYKILLGICFIEIGIIISKLKIIGDMSIGGKSILVLSGFGLAQMNGPVEMTVNNIGNPIIYFSSATLTSTIVMSLFKNAEHRYIRFLNVLEIYGKNSIVLLCTNNLLIEVIRLLDYKITGNILLSSGNGRLHNIYSYSSGD